MALADSTVTCLAQVPRTPDTTRIAVAPALEEVDSGLRTPSTLKARDTILEACTMVATIFEKMTIEAMLRQLKELIHVHLLSYLYY